MRHMSGDSCQRLGPIIFMIVDPRFRYAFAVFNAPDDLQRGVVITNLRKAVGNDPQRFGLVWPVASSDVIGGLPTSPEEICIHVFAGQR